MLIAFTGAGISAASGVPTFQSQPGIRDRLVRTYANRHPEKYQQTINEMKAACDAAEPNDAHLALAEYGVPVITMNVDGLHRRAGTRPENLLEIHGRLDDGSVVLYEDPAPLYDHARYWIRKLGPDDVLLYVGTSRYTAISDEVYRLAFLQNVGIVNIDHDAETLVRKALELHKDKIESLPDFFTRTEDLG